MEMQFIQMMQQCRSAIMQRDNQIAITQPKADAYDLLQVIVYGLTGQKGMAYEQSIVSLLDSEIAKMKEKLATKEKSNENS